MAASTGAIYIIAVGGGTVVTKASNGLFDKNANGSASQHWTVEYGDNDKTVAFQNAETGQWLRCFAGNGYGKIDTGEKQWWTLEEGPGSPGSYWLKCNDFPNAYLCNAYGAHADGNKVYAWPRELNWTHALTWHFKDAQAPGFKPKDVKGPSQAAEETSSSDSGAAHDKARDLEARESNVAEKERKSQELDDQQKQKREDLEKREGALAEKERSASDIAGREAALAEKEKRLSDVDRRDTALNVREQALAAKEAALKKQGEQLNSQGKTLSDIDAAASGKSKDDSAAQAAAKKKLEQAERTLAAREAAAAKREELAAAKEKANKAQEEELEKKLRAAGASAGDETELLKAQNENLKLQLLLKDLEQRLAKAETAVGSSTSAADASRVKKLEDENARLKNLVAQQVLKKQDAAGKTLATPSNTSRPLANSSRPVAPSHAVAGLPKDDAASKPSGGAPSAITDGPTKSTAAAVDPSELSRVRAELAKTKAELAKSKKAQRAGATQANGSGDGLPTSGSTTGSAKPSPDGKGPSASSGGKTAPKGTGAAASKPGQQRDFSKDKLQREQSGKQPPKRTVAGQHRDFPRDKLQPATATSQPRPNGQAVGQHRDFPKEKLQPDTTASKPASNGNTIGQHRDFPKSQMKLEKADGKSAANGQAVGQHRDMPKGKLRPESTVVKPTANGSSASKPSAGSNRDFAKDKLKPAPTKADAVPKPGSKATGSKVGAASTGDLPSQSKGKDDDEDDDEDIVHFECGHVAHQRPRKLNKKLVGYLYE